ncbi:hypothetical protein BKI52_21675 [marine bacterium AO1-C]|nr:hypothetical protein BKI52_21675 [marine bacterium AO1-C]
MHYSPTYSGKEKTAHTLWSQFTRRDQEHFWQQYEKLIVKKTQLFAPVQASSPKVEIAVIQPRSFHNRFLPYWARLVFLTVNLGLMGMLSVNAYFSVAPKSALNFLAVLALFFTIRPLWCFTAFYTSNQGLLVLRDLIFRKKPFTWREIHLIQLYRDQYKTAYIKIWLKSNEQKHFKYPLVRRNHYKFLRVLEHKNIFVENKL